MFVIAFNHYSCVPRYVSNGHVTAKRRIRRKLKKFHRQNFGHSPYDHTIRRWYQIIQHTRGWLMHLLINALCVDDIVYPEKNCVINSPRALQNNSRRLLYDARVMTNGSRTKSRIWVICISSLSLPLFPRLFLKYSMITWRFKGRVRRNNKTNNYRNAI